ncbi:Asp/Glu/hydantoin racemase (fragment) [Paraburkholderia ribeironis]|uniref:Asp/Glu/hydantoin racemase n=1 Tax=Paraburkholderia ribeironis TaxID=1247936 RepID=A0A1N7S8K3_9BURK
MKGNRAQQWTNAPVAVDDPKANAERLLTLDIDEVAEGDLHEFLRGTDAEIAITAALAAML